ncbi:hypothetical protein [Ruegeria atlantica]|uniref:hypothetical protein n=1 Tax=Ruegeria atlantica TaxID=81569 RepID=UPI00346152D7
MTGDIAQSFDLFGDGATDTWHVQGASVIQKLRVQCCGVGQKSRSGAGASVPVSNSFGNWQDSLIPIQWLADYT